MSEMRTLLSAREISYGSESPPRRRGLQEPGTSPDRMGKSPGPDEPCRGYRGRATLAADAVQPRRRDGLYKRLAIDSIWQRKGETLSDKTAREEFGLTQDEIYDAIKAGELQYRQAYMQGNPWLRLLRGEVEALARSKHGDLHVNQKQAKAELSRVNREIKRLRAELAELEERRDKLNSDLGA
jgi:hypothetical protein